MNTGLRIPIAGALALACGAALAQAPEGKLYTPGAFERVEIDGAGQVRLVQGERDEVLVNGNARQQEGVEVEVSGKTLHLDLPGGWKFWDAGKAQVEVRVRHLSKLSMQGAGDVYASGTFTGATLGVEVAGSGVVHFDDLRVDHLSFSISGSGEGQLAGRIDGLSLSVSGRGKVLAPQLQVGSAHVSISGVGNADLWVTDDLRVDISGAGHVRYLGSPKVRQSISGLGSVDASGDNPRISRERPPLPVQPLPRMPPMPPVPPAPPGRGE